MTLPGFAADGRQKMAESLGNRDKQGIAASDFNSNSFCQGNPNPRHRYPIYPAAISNTRQGKPDFASDR